MNTGRLYEFVVLARLLSFSKAAEALYISQSVLTRHIQELEKELGHPVLTRTTHGVALTEAGKVLLNEAPELINKCDSALRRLRSRSAWSKGSVRVGIAVEFAYSGHIRGFFRQFSGQYPDIELKYDVFTGSTPSIVTAEYDILFTPCVYHDIPDNVRRHLLRRHGTHAILPPLHPLISTSAIYLHQLAGQTIIVPHAQEPFGPYAQNWLLADKATKGQLSTIKVENLSTALFLVSMGKGICIAPRYAINLMPSNTFDVTISDRNCRFDEYLYFRESDNEAARLFYEELLAAEAPLPG